LNGLDISVPSRRPSLHKYFATNPDIVVAEIDYMRNVSKLLHSTDPRIITNYVFIQYVSLWSGELGERFDDVSQVSTLLKPIIRPQ
ncbi:hypothetical protein COOONC_01598, partial [Cooperia oncophora]